ncbi:MAG: helix-turn-helix transcriptional regulator [Chloroflexota bacterium]
MRLRNRVRDRRAELGLTQEQLAERAEVSVRAVGMIESGAGHAPTGAVMLRLASALGVPMNALFWSEDATPAEVAS